ncbi:hypothetical protein B0I35DRAFT_460348 [Stachybotrys elegans]|uniref:Uncharacterized protein n=1 Tax=Stachybotrys elegans TaxID=80388 RepID=A0A8K0WRK1_9HYPO|nr:hypothetical protein B0I35DRAFT_460348 [Stachybotrys elegans]
MATSKSNSNAAIVPRISPVQEELVSFQQAHFSSMALARFENEFMNLDASQQYPHDPPAEEWNDDGLGYYPDGVKRTLTDEQIEIFRHSELKALRRARERSKSAAAAGSAATDSEEHHDDDAALTTCSNEQFHSGPDKKKKKKKAPKRPRPEPKPDLRKRTWDVVDAGLDTLDYD